MAELNKDVLPGLRDGGGGVGGEDREEDGQNGEDGDGVWVFEMSQGRRSAHE